MTDMPDPRPRPLGARIVLMLGGVALALVLMLALIRVFIPTISNRQDQPPGHFMRPCIVCHFMSADAEIIEYDE